MLRTVIEILNIRNIRETFENWKHEINNFIKDRGKLYYNIFIFNIIAAILQKRFNQIK